MAVGTLLAASAWLLPRAIDRLRTERPRVIVDVVEGTNDRLQPMLLRGELDMVVGRLSEFRHRAGIHHEPIYSEEILLLARPGHRLAGRAHLRLARPPGSRLDSPAARDVPSPSTGEGVLRRRSRSSPLRGPVGIASDQPAPAARQRPSWARGRGAWRPTTWPTGTWSRSRYGWTEFLGPWAYPPASSPDFPRRPKRCCPCCARQGAIRPSLDIRFSHIRFPIIRGFLKYQIPRILERRTWGPGAGPAGGEP